MPLQIDHVIEHTDLQPDFGVRLDEIDYTSVVGQGYSVSHDSETAFAAATLPVLRPFPLADGRHTTRLYAGWAGAGDLPLVFSGEITATDARYFRREDSFTCGGYLKRTEVGLDLNVAFYYSGGSADDVQALLDQIDLGFQAVPVESDADIIVFILERYGITPETINYRIEASAWTPAKLSPIYWEAGTPGYQLIKQIDEITTFRTFDRRDGAIGRRQLLGTVPSNVRHQFIEGEDILDLQMGKSFSVYNQVIVRGAANESTGEQVEGISPIDGPVPSPYIPDPPGVRTDESINSPLIETVEDAELLADIRLGFLQEPLQTFTLTTFGCSDLDVGDAVGVYAPSMSIMTNAFVVSHTLTGQPSRSQFVLRGSTAAAPRPNQPPTAAFTATALKEMVIISGTATPITLITVDASTSSDSDGTITAVTINIGGTAYTPDPAHPIVTHPYLGLPPVTITVTVTDDGGLPSTLTQSLTWDESTIIVEPIATAELTRGELSDDAEVTWREFAGDVISVAPIALGSATLWGGQTGKIWRSTDRLKTPPTVAATLPAAVLCMWNNEIATARWLAGLANGDIWLSIDGGVTWTKQAHLSVTGIEDISESPYAPGQASACSGESLFETFDLRSWTPIVTKSGATALRLAAGFERGWVGFSDGTVQSTDGTTIALPGGAVRGLTLEREAEALHIYTDAAAPGGGFLSYRWNEAGGLVAGPNLPTVPNRAIRSGRGRFSYVACNGALNKHVFDAGLVYDVRVLVAPQQCLAVGYSSAAHPPSLVEVLIPSAGVALGKIWHYAPTHGTPDKWVGAACAPLNNRHAIWLAANPFNAAEWLLLINTTSNSAGESTFRQGAVQLLQADNTTPALWLTQDNGATWTAVTIAQGLGGGGTPIRIRNIEWSDATSGRWVMVGFNDNNTSVLYRGTYGSGTIAAFADNTTITGSVPRAQYVAAGQNDDAIVGSRDGLPTYSAISENRLTRLTAGTPDVRYLDRDPSTRALVGIGGGQLLATPDYRGASPTPRSGETLGNAYQSITWARSGVYVASTGTNPVVRVTDLFNPRGDGATVTTIVNPSSLTSAAYVRADRQRRESVLARLASSSGPSTQSLVSADGVQWSLLDGPAGVSQEQLAGIGEIVTRSGGIGTPPPPEAS